MQNLNVAQAQLMAGLLREGAGAVAETGCLRAAGNGSGSSQRKLDQPRARTVAARAPQQRTAETRAVTAAAAAAEPR